MNNNEIKSLLHTVDTSSLVDKVEINLVDFFIESGLQPGDSIPKENDLTSILGVSRTVIREALTRLKSRGIVESKKHKGTIIKSPDISSVLRKSLIPNILSNSTLREIFELRLVIEIGMSDSIFQHITAEDIDELEKIVKKEPKYSNELLFDIDHEIAFHGKLYQITRNETLKNFQDILLPVFNYAYDSGLIKMKIKKERFVSHSGLIDVLQNGNPKKFREAMRKHLENHYKRLFG